jgi:archaellum component FlaC
MSAENPISTNGEPSQRTAAASNVAPFPALRNDSEPAAGPPPGNAGTAQPDPLKELVGSLERWDNHFADNIRDVERRLNSINDKIRRHDELFPVVKQNFQSMQGSLNSYSDRIGQHAARLDKHTTQLVTLEANINAIRKDIAALRAEIGKDVVGLRAEIGKDVTALQAEVRSVRRGRQWGIWLALLALLGLAVSTAIQLGVVDVVTALMRLIEFG